MTAVNPDGRVGLIGTVSQSLADLKQLRHMIYAGVNPDGRVGLIGTVPQRLADLKQLRHLLLGWSPGLEGPLPAGLCHSNMSVLLLNGCNLTGTFEELLTCSNIDVLDISHNNFEGSLPSAPWGMNALTSLTASFNSFTGTLPEALYHLPTLANLELANNRLSGTVSGRLSLLLALQFLHLSHNNLSGTVHDSVWYTTRLASVDLSHNQLSGTISYIVGKPLSQAAEDCQGPGPAQLGEEWASMLVEPLETQEWEVNPAYYQFQGCNCLTGFQPVWNSNGTVLTCEADPAKSVPGWVVPFSATMFACVMLLVLAAVLLLWFKFAVQLKRKWQREKELKLHRQQGVPIGGPATIVVTDVEQFSDLTRLDGTLTMRALGLHNMILRKAAADHAGHVIEQEGDSWSVAFHTPMEAVAFCLQAQQALQKCSWPTELKALLKQLASMQQASLATGDGASLPSLTLSLASRHASSQVDEVALVQSMDHPSQPGILQGTKGLLSSVFGQRTAASRRPAWKSAGVIKGLKVRMGIATGSVPPDAAITRCALFELAKGVSEIANGGQVLLEAVTFAGVQDRVIELGAVDHRGYNDQLIDHVAVSLANKRLSSSILKGLWIALTRFLKKDMGIPVALLLDMGQYHAPNLLSALEAANNSAAVSQGQPSAGNQALLGGAQHNCSMDKTSHLRACNAAVLAVAAAMSPKGSVISEPSLHLYSVLAQPLHARAKAWKGRLNFKTSAQTVAKGFFEAPGTAAADLGMLPLLEVERPLLAPVTVVFAAVDKGKLLVQTKQDVAAVVHRTLAKLMQALLLCMQDGYLCREQEAVLKYMVAFRDPARAVEWCLLLQEVSEAFQQAVLHRKSTASVDGRPGSVAGLGARPRLKIGVAEGVPGSILPDHLGHVDYFGSSVNLAARVMDAAASGGQVVASCTLAEAVFTTALHAAMAISQPSAPASAAKATGACSVGGGLGTSRLSHVSAQHVGTYSFKGCGVVDMVCFTTEALQQVTSIKAGHAASKGMKGSLLMPSSGPVLGLQDCPVMLPDVLPALHQAWSTVQEQQPSGFGPMK
eukprot:gene10840-10996_t